MLGLTQVGSRFGQDDGHPKLFREGANKFYIEPEEVSQIKEKVISDEDNLCIQHIPGYANRA